MNFTPDKNLLDSLRAGSSESFETIFLYYFPRLVKFSQCYIADEEEARNIAQDVLLTLWNKRESLEDNSNINGYLLTLAKNRCLNTLKSFYHKYKIVAEGQYTDQVLNYYALQELNTDTLAVKELEAAIQETIAGLPPQCRQVFMMSRFENLKYREIAVSLNISEKTVENHISKALAILRKQLKDYMGMLVFFI